jgi:hypothetical protein
MGVTGPAQHTPAVDDVPFGCHPITDVYIGNETPDLLHIARKLVADDDGRLHPSASPFIPGVDVDVSATYSGSPDSDEDLVFPNRGFGNVHQLEAGTRRSLN